MKVWRRSGGLVIVAIGCLLPGLLRADDAAKTEPPQATRLGDAACLECHEQYASAWQTLRHNRYLRGERIPERLRGCEGCHGPGSGHLEDPEFKSIKNAKHMTGLAAAEQCLACHNAGLEAGLWLANPHAQAGLTCSACHEVHNDPGNQALLKKPAPELCFGCHADKRSEFKLNSHHPVLEGRIDCSDCHDPHALDTTSQELLKNGEDRCLTCHQDKRGPFVFEHLTTMDSGDEGCLACHRAHGSPNPKLTQYFGRGTCLQCHADIASDANHRPRGGNCWAAGCHNRIHGSNRDRLFMN